MSADDETTIELKVPGVPSAGPIPLDVFKAAADVVTGKKPDDFALEPDAPGIIPDRVIEELRHARTVAKDHAQAYGDACKAQAEKHKIKPGALKRYIAALCDDKLDDVDAETRDLERLIDEAS